MVGAHLSRSSSSDVPHVLSRVFDLLSQTDRCRACCVCREWRAVGNLCSLWQSLDLSGATNVCAKLTSAISQRRFADLIEVNFEFARSLQDGDLEFLRGKNITTLNLNACQNVSDEGVGILAACHPRLSRLYLYWNVRITNAALESLAAGCKELRELNLSGCKNIGDAGVTAIASSCPGLRVLNLTRCGRVTDLGLLDVVRGCPDLVDLNLYANSSLTDDAFTAMRALPALERLDVCGVQHLTDKGVEAIAKCSQLRVLNLTWCGRVTNVGVVALARNCHCLESLSLYGNVGVTDECLQALSRGCATTLSTLDVNGCLGMKKRSRDDLRALFPKLKCFVVHS